MDHVALAELARDPARRPQFIQTLPYMATYEGVNFRRRPDLYRIGRGEQGVLMAQPYSQEIGQYWRFRTPDVAAKSSRKIELLFGAYVQRQDFVGADMARKFLQMGWTRARRYANHPTGRKYYKGTRDLIPVAADNQTSPMAESARIFKAAYDRARTDPKYLKLKQHHKDHYESVRN